MVKIQILSAVLSTFLLSSPVLGQEIDKESIIDALVPKSGSGPVYRTLKGIDAVDGDGSQARPSIDIRIGFEFDSAQLDPNAAVTLRRLGQAINDERLSKFTFIIAGHTDAKGTEAYNQDLSERRASAIVAYLVGAMNVAQDRLLARGFGEAQLFDPQHPEDGINRRVQIVNVGEIR